ncbi:hypothetical protein ACFSTE_05785 [Aquimarina hainanensis]|uniref:Lipoprotein n=1 Tax=Aquimarina hainanensis TaxID=1578017 RepID=A0ABW5N848_9FLAO
MKSYLYNLGVIVITILFGQCGSTPKIEKTPPVKIAKSYFQKWYSGVAQGGSGFTVYIPVEEETKIVLQTAYFKERKIALQKEGTIYVGRYTYPETRKDLIMSDDPKKEFGNQLPVIEEKSPFTLKYNECIVSYKDGNKEGFFKINNLEEKDFIAYPSAKQ